MNLIDEVEEQTTTVCGPSSSLDRALLLIGRRHELNQTMTAAPSSSRQLRLREHQLFLALTILVGVLAGLSAVLFSRGHRSHDAAVLRPGPVGVSACCSCQSGQPDDGIAAGARVPGCAGQRRPADRGGVPPARRRDSVARPVGKFLTGVLCIGSGHSMGREGPSVQIGAGLASVIGRWVGAVAGAVKELVPVGAAGALAAAFNTPVAAVLFALEEIIGDMNASLLGSTVVASVASVVVERSILGQRAAVPCADVSPANIRRSCWRMPRSASSAASSRCVFCKALLGATRRCS